MLKHLQKREIVLNYSMRKLMHPWIALAFFTFFFLMGFYISFERLFGATPVAVLDQAARVIMAPVFARIYKRDIEDLDQITKLYMIGDQDLLEKPAARSWKAFKSELYVYGIEENAKQNISSKIPFIYEAASAPYITELRNKYNLTQLIEDTSDEYQAMLKVAAWAGTRWDHGVDNVPFGSSACSPAAIVEAGEKGAKFWCEIAAKLMVHTATALGWQARLVTISRNGYIWEHAVAELWSNKYNKWFVVDTDFNVIYEESNVPLSAFELCHYGEELQKIGKLSVRKIAPEKKSLPLVDLIPFYQYVHIDLRNDWCSRHLREGSPAGGDLSTWWTSRPSLDKIITAKTRIDDPILFDWKINTVAIHARSVEKTDSNRISVEISLTSYSPKFYGFEVSFDSSIWECLIGTRYSSSISGGIHVVRARVLTSSGYEGPISEIGFRFHDTSTLGSSI